MKTIAAGLVTALVLLAGCAGQVSRIEIPAGTSRLGPGPALLASLTLPAGTGPFPVVVLLHGCSGLQLDMARGTWRQLQDYAG